MIESDDSVRPFVEAGARLAELALLPSLRLNMPNMSHEQRAHVYSGLLGAVLGYMAADLGPDDAEAIYLGFREAFNDARAIAAGGH